jgi:hypothetical protein
MHKLILVFILTIAFNIANAQEVSYQNYDWEKEAKLHKLSPEDEKEFEIILKDKRVVEFDYDESGQLIEFYLRHKIVRVNSEEAIERNNRIYLPLRNVSNVVMQKARVITSDGKVKELDESDIKEAKDEEEKEGYKYFALEGVDKGSEIEYYYLIKLGPNYRGSREIFQGGIPKKGVSFELISPDNLWFEFNSLNGFPEPERDTANDDQNHWTSVAGDMPKLKEEPFAQYESNLMQIVYKLDRNLATGSNNIVSYGSASQILFERMYAEPSKKAGKKIEKMLKGIVMTSKNDEEKVRHLEEHIKTKFNLVGFSHEMLSDLEKILETNMADEVGLVKFFIACLESMDINHELVLTSDRSEIRMDEKFEAYNYLNEYLIYFPGFDKYLAPGSILNRLGFVPSDWIYNFGLFIKAVKVGEFATGVGTIKFIDAPGADVSYDKMNMQVDLTDLDEMKIDLKREFFGYYALNFQPIYDYIDEEDKTKMSEQIAKFISEEAEIDEMEIENEGTKHFGVDPFIMNAKLTASSFVEHAGEKYLFKVGELIGPQVEMYQEEERVLAVENDFNRKYYREISFKIPDGYKIPNLDDLNIDIFHEAAGKRTMAFTSRYEVKDGTVTIKVDEYYDQIWYPVEEYEHYRKVINAAADFNKIVLILEKG